MAFDRVESIDLSVFLRAVCYHRAMWVVGVAMTSIEVLMQDGKAGERDWSPWAPLLGRSLGGSGGTGLLDDWESRGIGWLA